MVSRAKCGVDCSGDIAKYVEQDKIKATFTPANAGGLETCCLRLWR